MRRKKAPQKKHSRHQVAKTEGSTCSKWGQYVTPTLSDDEDYSVQTHSSNTKVVDIRSSKWRDFRIQQNIEVEDDAQESQQTQKITNDWGQFETVSVDNQLSNPMKKQKLEFRNNLRDSKNENWQANGKATEVKKQWSNILDQNKIFDVQVKSVPNTLTTSMKHEDTTVHSKWGKYLSPDEERKQLTTDEEHDNLQINERQAQTQYSDTKVDEMRSVSHPRNSVPVTNTRQNEQQEGATSDKPILFNSGDISDDELDQLLQF